MYYFERMSILYRPFICIGLSLSTHFDLDLNPIKLRNIFLVLFLAATIDFDVCFLTANAVFLAVAIDIAVILTADSCANTVAQLFATSKDRNILLLNTFAQSNFISSINLMSKSFVTMLVVVLFVIQYFNTHIMVSLYCKRIPICSSEIISLWIGSK